MITLPPIVSIGDLDQDGIAGDRDVVVVDARLTFEGPSGRQLYEAGHLPGAIFVDVDDLISAPKARNRGDRPLPSPEDFAAGLGAVGIGRETPTVVYDDYGSLAAGRLVWMLRTIGQQAALLSGGIAAFDGPLSKVEHRLEPVKRTAVPWPEASLASADDAAAQGAGPGVLADSRGALAYAGSADDPTTGHIPGAISLPWRNSLNDQNEFLDAAALTIRFEDVGVDGDTVLYCGAGVSACYNALAVEAAGLGRPRIYIGSWSHWSGDPKRPVEAS